MPIHSPAAANKTSAHPCATLAQDENRLHFRTKSAFYAALAGERGALSLLNLRGMSALHLRGKRLSDTGDIIQHD